MHRTCPLLTQSGHQARTHDCMVFLMRGSHRQLPSTVNVSRLIEHDAGVHNAQPGAVALVETSIPQKRTFAGTLGMSAFANNGLRR